MTIQHVIFVVLSAVALMGGLGAVTSRNLFRAALWLVVSFVGVAGFYVALQAEFLAMVQILVYVGAISILIIFAIMLSRRMMSGEVQVRNEQWIGGLIAAVTLFAILAYVLLTVAWPVFESEVPEGAIAALGAALVDPAQFLLPFEVASVLLLVALVGAVIIARER